MLTVVYFAWVRELIGLDEERVEPPAGAKVADVVASLAARSDGHTQALSDGGRLRAALDQQFVALDTPVGAARELALFPPVTGG
ncbi:MAG: MoaD/ThiS family protein [Sphingobium sp.]|nr:MoaD/ThiS family protein [Sphingobium sp.]